MIVRGADTFINARGQELVGHGTAIFPLGCYEENVSESPVHWHWHEDWEIVLVTKGVIKIRTASGDILLRTGEAVFLGAGCVHEITGEEAGCVLRSAVFHPRFISGMESLIWQKYIQPLQDVGTVVLRDTVPWQKECIALFSACWAALDEEPLGYEIQAREAMTKVAFLLYSRMDIRQRRPCAREIRNNRRIRTMLQYIQEHYAEDINVSKVAASAMLSESECLRCFRSTINTTPSQYLRDYRLQAAARLLASTDERAGDIGAACGLPDAAYFTKLFRENMGCTPGEYRKARRRIRKS